MDIKVAKPDKNFLKENGVFDWPIWEKEASRFPWHYDSKETCYMLKGEAEVICENGERVIFQEGDLVVFPSGLSCTWNIKKAIRKHYKFD